MTALNIAEARANLYNLIDDTLVSDEPVFLTGKRGNAALLAEDERNAINKTLHLLSAPGMRDSILKCVQKKNGDCTAELEW